MFRELQKIILANYGMQQETTLIVLTLQQKNLYDTIIIWQIIKAWRLEWNGHYCQNNNHAPFWLTWWFMLLVFLMVAGSCIGFYSFRMNIIQKQKLLLEEKVNDQTVELVHFNLGERKARLEAGQTQSELMKSCQ